MSTSETPNLHLVKPDYDELADIEVINENMDTIDAAVKAVQDSVSYIVDNVAANIAVAASGFEVTSAGYRQFGKVAFITVIVKSLNALTAGTLYHAATVVQGRRPIAGIGCTQSNVYNNVAAGIATSGVVNIRPSVTINANVSMNFTAVYLLP